MATVHPSRMGLVPQDPKNVYPDSRRGRSPSPPRRYDRDRREREKRARDSDGGERDERRESRRDRDDDQGSPRRRDHRERDRGRHQSEDKDEASKGRRRASPEYGDYKRPASPPSMPRMYPNRPPQDGAYERRSYGGGEYLERYVTQCLSVLCAQCHVQSEGAEGKLHADHLAVFSESTCTRTVCG